MVIRREFRRLNRIAKNRQKRKKDAVIDRRMIGGVIVSPVWLLENLFRKGWSTFLYSMKQVTDGSRMNLSSKIECVTIANRIQTVSNPIALKKLDLRPMNPNDALPSAKSPHPKLPKIILRPRLFKYLDETAPYAVTWLSAMAGSGKTTYALSYLTPPQASAYVWYRLDSGDSDPAIFFPKFEPGRQWASLHWEKAHCHCLHCLKTHAGGEAFAHFYFEITLGSTAQADLAGLRRLSGAGSTLTRSHPARKRIMTPLHAAGPCAGASAAPIRTARNGRHRWPNAVCM